MGENGLPDWTKIVISGHSQGASHAAYIAYRKPVAGAIAFSGPQDMCQDEGAAWPDGTEFAKKNTFACYAVDEPGVPKIVSNLGLFEKNRSVTTIGRERKYGQGLWCPPPAHCAVAVDDQLVEDAIVHCWSFLDYFA